MLENWWKTAPRTPSLIYSQTGCIFRYIYPEAGSFPFCTRKPGGVECRLCQVRVSVVSNLIYWCCLLLMSSSRVRGFQVQFVGNAKVSALLTEFWFTCILRLYLFLWIARIMDCRFFLWWIRISFSRFAVFRNSTTPVSSNRQGVPPSTKEYIIYSQKTDSISERNTLSGYT